MNDPQIGPGRDSEGPWKSARGSLPADAESSVAISTDEMAEFYRAHGLLGGRRAADLAAGGIHVRTEADAVAPFDVDAFLAGLADAVADPGPDPMPGGNLEAPAQDLDPSS